MASYTPAGKSFKYQMMWNTNKSRALVTYLSEFQVRAGAGGRSQRVSVLCRHLGDRLRDNHPVTRGRIPAAASLSTTRLSSLVAADGEAPLEFNYLHCSFKHPLLDL